LRAPEGRRTGDEARHLAGCQMQRNLRRCIKARSNHGLSPIPKCSKVSGSYREHSRFRMTINPECLVADCVKTQGPLHYIRAKMLRMMTRRTPPTRPAMKISRRAGVLRMIVPALLCGIRFLQELGGLNRSFSNHKILPRYLLWPDKRHRSEGVRTRLRDLIISARRRVRLAVILAG
jgi:hypothetical protein